MTPPVEETPTPMFLRALSPQMPGTTMNRLRSLSLLALAVLPLGACRYMPNPLRWMSPSRAARALTPTIPSPGRPRAGDPGDARHAEAGSRTGRLRPTGPEFPSALLPRTSPTLERVPLRHTTNAADGPTRASSTPGLPQHPPALADTQPDRPALLHADGRTPVRGACPR